jgi:hypothetical protein
LLGLAGLLAVAVAVGGLTGSWWWTVLVGGLEAFGLAWVAQAASPTPAEAASTAPTVRDTAVTDDAWAKEMSYMRGEQVTSQ